MNDPRLESLLDEASACYNSGAYDRAIALWRQVLAVDPENQKAREGVRMSSLLGTEWKEPAGIAASSAPGEEKIAAAVQRVRALVTAGALDDAREGLALLEELAPGLPEVNHLAGELARAEAGSSSEAVLEACLAEARAALLGGHNAKATAAAERALGLDPGNMEACGILSRAADDRVDETDQILLEDELIPLDHAELSADGEASESAGRSVASEGDDRVAQLLAKGKLEADSGRIEDAIATWSRIFAVDSANVEAGALIDAAKLAIEARGRQIDQLYYSGIDAIDAGRTEEGLAILREVLTGSPLHIEARERIEEIERGRESAGAPIEIDRSTLQGSRKEKSATQGARGREDVFEDPEIVSLAVPLHRPQGAAARAGSDSDAEPEGRSAAETSYTRAQAAPSNARRLAAAAGGLLVVGAGIGAWLWLGSDSGSMKEAQALPAAVATQPIARATGPGEGVVATTSGAKTLQVLPGSAPKPQAKVPEPPPDTGAQLQEADTLEREGRRYLDDKRWAESVLALRRALELNPVKFDSRDQLDSAMKELEHQAALERETDQSVKFFNEGDYASALHKFYRLQQDRPEMKQFDRWIVTAWFNWGVTLMQAASVDEAVEKFDEVLAVTPGDREAVKAREIAKRYHRARADSGLTAFANALPLRQLQAD